MNTKPQILPQIEARSLKEVADLIAIAFTHWGLTEAVTVEEDGTVRAGELRLQEAAGDDLTWELWADGNIVSHIDKALPLSTAIAVVEFHHLAKATVVSPVQN